jgi:polysaccharide biosynthesis/export protein
MQAKSSWPRTARFFGVTITSFFLCATVAGQQNPSPAHAPGKINSAGLIGTAAPDAEHSLCLGPGDLLEISVYNVPELTSKSRVSSAGEIYLPLINYVQVGGLTREQAERLLEERLADGGFVKRPHVTIFVDLSASQNASILGEVARPGVYPIIGEQRLFDLISAAGGLNDRAGRTVTLIHRSQPEVPITISMAHNLADSPESNVPVLPGDTVIVRKADVVYVVGEVGRPSGMLMESGHLTVLQAVALAGGTTRTAKLSAARIIRKGPNGLSETPVHLKKMLEAKAPDLPMQADDILFVPTSAGKAFAGHTLQAALQAATAASIITVLP